MLLNSAATDGILRWLGLVITDYIPAWDPTAALVISASLSILLELAIVSSLFLRQLYSNNQTMDNNEMAVDSSSP